MQCGIKLHFWDILILKCLRNAQVMEGSTGNSKNVPKKSTRLGRMIGFRQYTLRLRCEPKSLQPACTKFSNFVPILDTSTFTTPSFISSGANMLYVYQILRNALSAFKITFSTGLFNFTYLFVHLVCLFFNSLLK